MTRLKLMRGSLNRNQHGPEFTVIRGPKFTFVKLASVHAPSTGHRLYFYFPSGKCWYLDFYFDRRKFAAQPGESAKEGQP